LDVNLPLDKIGGEKMNSKKIMMGALLAAVALGAAGGMSLNALQASAQTSTPAPTTQSQPQGQFDPAKGGHEGTNGMREELLTGDTADKVRQAALAAVPGGIIERVETDAEGSPYEAHMTTADGTHVTVKVDANFKATTTEEGHLRSPQ
jgi:hypothetical protein